MKKMRFKRIKRMKNSIKELFPDEDVYDQKSLLQQCDDEEITQEECGFMIGYLSA